MTPQSIYNLLNLNKVLALFLAKPTLERYVSF